MMRHRSLWLAFALCLLVVLAAMGWASHTVLRLDRAQRASRRLAQREELVRLALWRMDGAVTAVVAQEGARPHYQYQAFCSATDALTRGGGRVGERGILIPSPLLRPSSPLVRLYFQMSDDKTLASPQVPTGPMRSLAAGRYVADEAIRQAAERLVALEQALLPDQLLARLPAVRAAPAGQPWDDLLIVGNPFVENRTQEGLNIGEFNARNTISEQFRQWNADGAGLLDAPRVRDGQARTVWVGGELLLARRVVVGGRMRVVGCWFDWPKLQRWLLDNVRDLLPAARLAPLPAGASEAQAGRLATLPVVLEPGHVPTEGIPRSGALAMSLAAAWVGLVLAAGAVAMLLRGTLSLSERRGAFVSAVTHELRTPLTTLRMYSDMLQDGMVADQASRSDYLHTMQNEIDRLCRLVENVLAYSRLEGRRFGAQGQTVAAGPWLEQVRPRLARRAEQAGMELVVRVEPDAAKAAVAAEATALEQIVANLVDNACKYAAGAADRRIHVGLGRAGDDVLLRVRDHGPGIAAQELDTIFRPFVRAGRDVAGPSGGLGLGLAISRRLARALGGDLTAQGADGGGTRFTLRLPGAAMSR